MKRKKITNDINYTVKFNYLPFVLIQNVDLVHLLRNMLTALQVFPTNKNTRRMQ